MEKGIKHLLHNIRGGDDKAFCLLATSYKGAWANGMTLICNFDMDKICVASRGRQMGGDGEQTTPTFGGVPRRGQNKLSNHCSKRQSDITEGKRKERRNTVRGQKPYCYLKCVARK